ncbi:MAG: tetratricopeptide repeat protein [Bacteroidetes bacterium]|nr:tetratricopeptide repeat protein [Bacteroidota bacterium]
MKNSLFTLIFLFSFCAKSLFAQKENVAIRKGNRLYKEQKLDESQKQYQQALQESPDNPAALYNLGNTQFRKNSFEDAVKSYDALLDHTDNNKIKQQGYYNKGVALAKEQKLEESIAAWKDALKLDPNDEDARENLQKALMEQKNKQQQQQKDDKKQKDKKQDKNKDQQKKDQDKKDQQQQQQPKSRLSKQQVEQLLKALQQKEKDAQDKMNQNKTRSLSQPDKDW